MRRVPALIEALPADRARRRRCGVARLRRSRFMRQSRGSRTSVRSLCLRTPRSACEGSRLVAREPHLLWLALSGRGNDGRVRRQGIGSEPRAADAGRSALFRRALSAQVHQDGDVAAHDACGQPHDRARPPRASRGSREWKRTRAPPTSGSRKYFPDERFELGARIEIVTAPALLRPRRPRGAGDGRGLRHRARDCERISRGRRRGCLGRHGAQSSWRRRNARSRQPADAQRTLSADLADREALRPPPSTHQRSSARRTSS